ncbi:MAG: winged helix-turn-helix domain-containing protein [Candidatus Rokubacteria bacterium]|nr:winged helix-turn-helix domain-containing protein [Candidatus Rokubacteria bacterium]
MATGLSAAGSGGPGRQARPRPTAQVVPPPEAEAGGAAGQKALGLGYRTDLWTTRRVAEVIRRHFGVRYHPNHVWRLLVGLGCSYQKPERRAQERDEAAIERWKRVRWPAVKKTPPPWRSSRLPR